MIWKYFIASVLLISMRSQAQVQKWIDRTAEVNTKEANVNLAKKELIDLGTAKISEEVIKEVIGESKYTRNRNLIENKIIKNSARYIPITRPGDVLPDQDGYKMIMGLRINMDDLQSILLENGLFYEQDGTPIILPMIKFSDKISGKSFFWWSNQEDSLSPVLSRESKNIEEVFQNSFQKNNFYFLKPHNYHYSEMLPAPYRVDTLSMDDYQNIAQAYLAPLMIRGEINLVKGSSSESYKVEMKMSAIQVSNGRSIAEISRNYDVEGSNPDTVLKKKLKDVSEAVAADLSIQVLDAWQKGAIGTSLYKITIQGRLNIPQQELFKEALKSKVREIKAVKERLITSEETVYEADSAITPKEILTKSQEIELNGTVLVAVSANELEVVFQIKKR